MMSVSSAFWAALQRDEVNITEFIELTSPIGTYRWCVSPQPLVSSRQVYDPFPGGTAKGAEESTTLRIGSMVFTIANTGALPRLLRSNALYEAEVYAFRALVDSPDIGRLPVFRGKLGDITHNRDAITGQLRDRMGSVAKQFPYYTYQDTCVWRFGSVGCGVDTTSLTTTQTLVGSSIPIILYATSGTLVRSYAPGQLERGRVTVLTGLNSGQIRTVRVSTGDMLALSHTLPFAVSSGDTFSLYPGCRKRFNDDCTSKYNNAHRSLSFAWMPKQEQAF